MWQPVFRRSDKHLVNFVKKTSLAATPRFVVVAQEKQKNLTVYRIVHKTQ
jgi:hypothetical protein